MAIWLKGTYEKEKNGIKKKEKKMEMDYKA